MMMMVSENDVEEKKRVGILMNKDMLINCINIVDSDCLASIAVTLLLVILS